MIDFSGFSIKQKLISIIMLTSTITLVFGSIAFILNDRYAARNTMSYILSSQAKIIGANSTAALIFDDTDAAEETLATLKTQEHVLNAAIFKPDSTIFTIYIKDSQQTFLEPDYKPRGYAQANGFIRIFEPIELHGEVIGTVYIMASTTELLNNIAGYSGIMLATLIIALGLALLLSTQLQRAITSPILAIKRFTDKITRHQDYSLRINQEYRDELGTVIKGINSMLEQIEHRDQQLEEHAQTLEQKVIQRTEELEEMSNQLRHQAYHDPLTGLPNRILLYERMELSINQGERYNNTHAIFYIDLDGFKQVNDKYGHAAGDRLLKTMADRMHMVIRNSDTLSRLGGDEFAVILNDIESRENARRMAENLLQAIREPVDCHGTTVNVSGSIGISMFPAHSKDPVNLMKFADAAMYQAKHAGKNNCQFYQPTVSDCD